MRRATIAALCLALLGPARAQDLPTYTCWRAATPPAIDGAGEDAAWAGAEILELFDVEDLTRQRQHTRTTRVRMLWDETNLYFLFDLSDADVWSTYSSRDEQLWQEEVVEFFVDPDGDGANYAEIEINPLNAVFDLLLSRPWGQGGRGFPQWNPDFSSAVRVRGTLNDPGDVDQGWSVEMALPWAALATDIRDVMNGLPLPPRPGDQWRFNLYRFERLRLNGSVSGVEASAWSPVGTTDFHTPERFGFLSFAGVRTAVEEQSWGHLKEEANER